MPSLRLWQLTSRHSACSLRFTKGQQVLPEEQGSQQEPYTPLSCPTCVILKSIILFAAISRFQLISHTFSKWYCVCTATAVSAGAAKPKPEGGSGTWLSVSPQQRDTVHLRHSRRYVSIFFPRGQLVQCEIQQALCPLHIDWETLGKWPLLWKKHFCSYSVG